MTTALKPDSHLERSHGFEITHEYTPKGDQPGAIAKLTEGIRHGMKHQGTARSSPALERP